MVVATRHDLGPEGYRPAPANLVHVQLFRHALEELAHIGDPLDFVELGIDADLFEVALDRFLPDFVIAILIDVEIEIQTVRIAGFGEQCLGAFGIVFYRRVTRLVGVGAGAQHAHFGTPRALENAIGDGVAVDRHIDRLAHPDILHDRVLMVEEEQPDRRDVLVGGDGEALVFEVLELFPGRFHDHRHFAGANRVEAGGLIG